MNQAINVGQQVAGNYCGEHQFSGEVIERRAVTVPTDGCFLFTVKLDNAITVYGEARDTLTVSAKINGDSSSYVRHSDSMSAI